jgi:hypothetical protein
VIDAVIATVISIAISFIICRLCKAKRYKRGDDTSTALVEEGLRVPQKEKLFLRMLRR